tara:strand:- start:2878 stop:3162 length:285 start_codon:yes stop_codon:yes gene_type:complete
VGSEACQPGTLDHVKQELNAVGSWRFEPPTELVTTAPALANESEVKIVRVKLADDDFANARSISQVDSEIRHGAVKACDRTTVSSIPLERSRFL